VTDITDEMVTGFARLTQDRNPVHVDDAFARRSIHRRRIAHGALLSSLALGRYHESGYTYGTTLLLLDMQTEFKARAFIGDRVYAEFLVVEKEREPHRRRGLVTFHAWLRHAVNHEEIVAIRFTAMIRRATTDRAASESPSKPRSVDGRTARPRVETRSGRSVEVPAAE